MSRNLGFLVLPLAWAAGLLPARAAAAEPTLPPRSLFEGRVAVENDVDPVFVDLLEGTTFTARVLGLTGGLKPRLVLLRDGVEVGEGDPKVGKKGRLHVLAHVPIEESGAYEVRVFAPDGSIGDYRLRVKEKLPETTKSKVFASAASPAEVRFPVRAGSLVRLVLQSKADALPVPQLFDPLGQAIDLSSTVVEKKGGRRLEIGPLLLPDDGVCRLVVSGPGSAATKVRVKIAIDPPADTWPLVFEPQGQAALSASVELEDGEWTDPSSWQQNEAPGEVLVKLAPGASAARVAAELGLERGGGPVGGWLRLVDPEAAALASALPDVSRRRSRAALARARSHPAVSAAQPNFRRAPLGVPNDPAYGEQWDLPLCRFPEAWEVVQGDPTRAVAVLDTGIRYEHPDLAGRLLQGYDFVHEIWNAGDGDGPDDDATDVFVSTGTHGSHVAGTIAAGFDNGTGIAGAVPKGWILPVRVLGVLGGTDFDVAQGLYYVAGAENEAGHGPPVEVDVVNMSLGGTLDSPILHDAVRAAYEQGILIVAAAGNTGKETAFYPAFYPEVVAVGATNLLDERADYSTTGDHVLLAAPGGDMEEDLDGDGEPDGVLSTVVRPLQGPTLERKAGTSMAAPHVSAAAYLLKSAVPSLTAAQITAYLAASAHDLGPPGRDPETGYGRLDVKAALDLALGQGAGSPDPFAISPVRLSGTGGRFAVVNRGGGSLQVLSVASDVPWIVPKVSSGSAPLDLEIEAHPEILAAGTYESTLTVVTDAGTLELPVRLIVDGNEPLLVDEAKVVAVDVVDGVVRAQMTIDETSAQGFDFEGIPEGTYVIYAVTDLDRDGMGGEEHDWIGALTDPATGEPLWVELPDGTAVSGDTIVMERGRQDLLPKGKPLELPP